MAGEQGFCIVSRCTKHAELVTVLGMAEACLWHTDQGTAAGCLQGLDEVLTLGAAILILRLDMQVQAGLCLFLSRASQGLYQIACGSRHSTGVCAVKMNCCAAATSERQDGTEEQR